MCRIAVGIAEDEVMQGQAANTRGKIQLGIPGRVVFLLKSDYSIEHVIGKAFHVFQGRKSVC
jgi:hypothetical protein